MIKLTPAFKDYIWGGTKLKTEYGKKAELDIVAESWELSTHKDGPSVIANGKHAGKTLADYIKAEGKTVLGTHTPTEEELSILIKFIDARDNLSVQVHPDDAYALIHEGDFGKTEMWYVLDCEEGAQLVYGFTKDITKEDFRNYIETNTLSEVLNYVDVKKGDVFFIQAGTLHAIGKGIQIAEIQQSSNVTYRVYDYGRIGVDGKPRDLHIEKAIEVTKLAKADAPRTAYTFESKEGYSQAQLAHCKYFSVDTLKVTDKATLTADETSYHCIVVLEGAATICSKEESLQVIKGETVFIPAGSGEYSIKGDCQVVLSRI